jgi:large subunit ribosomal protein L27
MLRKDLLVNFNTIAKRTATKRAGGGKTNNKDSAGRALGAKKVELQFVQANEVLMKQTGTKFFGGENTFSGRDHTINSSAPGYVRFYIDPFHPKKRFVGVALSKDSVLPRGHFLPKERRFNNIKLNPREKIEMKLINNLLESAPRFFTHPREQRKIFRIQQNMKDRIAHYDAKQTRFNNLIKEQKVLEGLWGEDFVKTLSAEENQFVVEFLYLMQNKFEYSHNIDAAFEYTKNEIKYDNKLQEKRSASPTDVNIKYQYIIPRYYDYSVKYNEALAKKIQETVDFNKLDLDIIKKIPSQEKEAKKAQLIEEVSNIKPFLYTKNNANFKKITSMLSIKNALIKQVFDNTELNQLKNKLFPEVLPSSWEGVLSTDKKDRNAIAKKMYDPDTKTFEDVLVSKFAFKDNAKDLLL